MTTGSTACVRTEGRYTELTAMVASRPEDTIFRKKMDRFVQPLASCAASALRT